MFQEPSELPPSLHSTFPDPLTSTQDLTGQVIKAEQWCFAWGGSADIWKAQLTKPDGSTIMVAVKVIKGCQGQGQRLLRETKVWSTVLHNNITPFLGISFDFDRPRTPCLVSPYYRNGDIMSYLKTYPDTDRLPWIAQVAGALLYLHDQGIIHGDMKGSNILINDNGEACLTDFGLARILEVSGFTTKTGSGTTRYMAPEQSSTCVAQDETFVSRVTKATDSWAFGMTITEIFSGFVPFAHIGFDAAVVLTVAAGIRPKRERYQSIDDEIWMMLERCWDVKPNQRPSMKSLCLFFASRTPVVGVRAVRLPEQPV